MAISAMADKGKGKATQAAARSASPASSTAKPTPPAASAAAAPASTSTSTAAAAAPTASATLPMHTKGDWSAVWNGDFGKYYYWNRKTNTTTWTNPFESGAPPLPADSPVDATASSAAVQGEASTSKDTTTTAQSPQPSTSANNKDDKEGDGNEARGPSTADYGGIDPDLAYLDPSLASRARGAGGAGAYVARFNARTGKFESDPTKTPDRVSDVQRAKRQNQFYFDYDGWQATLAQQQEQTALKRAAEDGEDDSNKKARPSKKEMEAIRIRNKEKKDKKQKGWLMN